MKLFTKVKFITIDMGCRVNGYCSDMTRTIFAEFIPPEIKEIYDFVLKNQLQVIDLLKEGKLHEKQFVRKTEIRQGIL